MSKGQGSTEYILILAAILAIVIVIFVISQDVFNTSRTTGNIAIDQAKCTLNDAELIGYDEMYTGDYDGTEPSAIQWKTKTMSKQTATVSTKTGKEVCELGDHKLFFDRAELKYFLEIKGGNYIEYNTGTVSQGAGAITATLTGGSVGTDILCGTDKKGYVETYSLPSGAEIATGTLTVSGVLNPSSVKLTFKFGGNNEGKIELRGNGIKAGYVAGIDLLAKGLIKTKTASQTITVGVSQADKSNRICDHNSDNWVNLSYS